MSLTPRILTADRGDDGLRLDLVLRRHLQDLRSATRTRVQAWIETGLVTVNGVAVRRVSSRAALGDIVSILLPEEAPRAVMAAEDVPVDVLYEDDERSQSTSRPASSCTDLQHGGDAMNALARARMVCAAAVVAGQPPRQAQFPGRRRRQDGDGARPLQRAWRRTTRKRTLWRSSMPRERGAGDIDFGRGASHRPPQSGRVGHRWRGESYRFNGWRASRRHAPDCRCPPPPRDDEPTRSGCIWPRAVGHCGDPVRRAAQSDRRSHSRRCCARSPDRRCMPGGWGSLIRSRARGSASRLPCHPTSRRCWLQRGSPDL